MRGCAVTSAALLHGDSCSGREKPAAKENRILVIKSLHSDFSCAGKSEALEIPMQGKI